MQKPYKMKKSQLRQIIKEEISKVLKEEEMLSSSDVEVATVKSKGKDIEFNIKDLKKIQTALKQVKSNKQVKLTTTSTGSTSTSPKHLAKLMIKDIDELIIKMESLEKNLKLFHHTSSLARRN